MSHNAQRYHDEYQCIICGRSWAVDSEPPTCVGEGAGREMFLEQRRKLKEQVKETQV